MNSSVTCAKFSHAMKKHGKRDLEEAGVEEDASGRKKPSKRKLPLILECPVCANLCQPPIYNCALGHSVCNDCRKKWKKCGLCKAKMTDSRNFIAEELVETYQFPCEYEDQGCSSRMLGVAYETHVENCDYGRPVKCHLGHLDGCDHTSHPYVSYLNHILVSHKLQELSGVNGSFDVLQTLYDYSVTDTLIWRGVTFSFDHKTFLPLTFIQSNVLYFSVAVVGSEQEAKLYQVKIKLKHPLKLKWVPEPTEVTVPVLSIRNANKEFMRISKTATVSKSLLQHMCLVDQTEDGFSFEWLARYDIVKVPTYAI